MAEAEGWGSELESAVARDPSRCVSSYDRQRAYWFMERLSEVLTVAFASMPR